MENKSDSVRREILKSIIDRYGNKSKKVVVQKVKEQGVYKNYQDDNEVYNLVQKFAEFHKLPFGYTEPKPKIEPETILEKVVQENIEKAEEVDLFYETMLKEHSMLSKKLLTLTKLIDIYKSDK